MNFVNTRLFSLPKYFLISISLFSWLLFLPIKTFAQVNPETIDFVVHCTKDKKNLSGATVTVFKNTYIQFAQKKSGSLGKVQFDLPFGYDYKITFSYPGCVDMFEEVKGKSIPQNKTDIYPKYKGEVPFFETSDIAVRKDKYKNAFNRVIYDGRESMMDDEPYLQKFTHDIILNDQEQADSVRAKLIRYRNEEDRKIAAKEKAKKDKEAQERALADKAARDKMDAEQKKKFDEELAKRKAKEEEDADNALIAEAQEKARLKNEEDAKQQKESRESEAEKAKREAEEKAIADKKKNEQDQLNAAAEKERSLKQKAMAQMMEEARANSIIEQMKRDAELKSRQETLAKEEKEKEQKSQANQHSKYNEVKKLVVAAATAERNVKVTQHKAAPDLKAYVRKETPHVKITEVNGFLKDVRTTVITYYEQNDTYRKERSFWGGVSYFKNNKEIDELVYNVEIDFYSSYANK